MKRNDATQDMTRSVDVDDLLFIDDFDDIIETVEKAEKAEKPGTQTRKTEMVNKTNGNKVRRDSTARSASPEKAKSASGHNGRAVTPAPAHRTSASKKSARRKGIAGILLALSKKEKMILAGGLAAILLFVTVGSIAVRAHGRSTALRSFAGIGRGYDASVVIGAEGLVAADTAARLVTVEEETEEHEEEIRTVEIDLVVQTIKSDLKIKFVDKETGRVATGIAFGAKVTDPEEKEETHYDTDKDGVIYIDGLAGGNYLVEFVPPRNDREGIYKDAQIAARSVTVTDTVTMAAVDVSDEVVDEAAAGPAGEAGDLTPVESVPQDTVAWVESTRTPLNGGGTTYQKIDRSQISDPYTAAAAMLTLSDFVYLDDEPPGSGDPGSGDPGSGDPGSGSSSGDPGSGDPGSGSSGGGNTGGTGTTTPQPNYAVTAFTVTNNNLFVGESTDFMVTAAGGNVVFDYNRDALSVGNNRITALKEGSYTITARVEGSTGEVQTVLINVFSQTGVSLNTTNATLKIGETLQLSAAPATVTYSSSDNSVATVDGNGVVRAVGTGNATITAQGTGTFRGSATCNVKVDAGIDESATLKDKNGNIVYKQNGNTYVPASNADYRGSMQLYIAVQTATQYRYTGWQTIEGNTYYYDSNGNYVTGKQVIRGVEYNFNQNGVLSMSASNVGIDVSAHQGVIDWNAVKSAGISFAIIRCGFRGYETGRLAEDSTYRRNIQGAINAGIKVGIYVYSSAVNDVEAVEEASFAISLARGYNLALPIFIDVENPAGGRARNIDAGTRTAVIKAFCGTVQNSGYRAGVYSNTTWYNSMINTPELTGYTIWLAQYNDRPTYTRTKFDLWQYSSKGRIPGINTNVDMNYSYINF